MVGFEAFGLGNSWDVGLFGLCSMAGFAEDLKVFTFVCSSKCKGKNVINVPRLAGFDLLRAGCACAFSFQEQV